MSLKIFHTGDIHLGMKFNRYSEEVRATLVEARFKSVEKMIDLSNDLNSDLFVIAGDLFNTIQVAKRDIERCVNILNRFNGACVAVLPGNHDYDNGMTDLWKEFAKIPSEKVLLVNEPRVYLLDDYGIDAALYAAPCHSKHSKENVLGWVKEAGIVEGVKHHIGVAHGAIEGLSADLEGNYYSMGLAELRDISTDLWLLGHTHVCYPTKETVRDHKVFNPGTPEPDGLDFRGAGVAWSIELDEKGSIANTVATGEYRFFDKEFIVDSQDDLEAIKPWLLEGSPDKKIVRINLKGSIAQDDYMDLSQFYREIEGLVFDLTIMDEDLKMKIDSEIIEKEFSKGSFPYEFLTGLIHDPEALQIAYDLVRRG